MLQINVIIPTCNRAENLYHSIKSCLNQDYENYKIWVSDNNSLDNTAEVVNSFNDPRINYIKTPKSVCMSDNWEFALSHVTEGYVMFIGDDDGLLPNCLTHIAKFINEFNVLGFMSYPFIYDWQSDFYSFYKDNSYFLVNSSGLVNEYVKALEYPPEFWLTPTLYHGMISYDVLKKIKERDGRFFNSLYPDVYSNIIMMPEMDRYVLSFMPFCIDGVSKYSTGSALSSTHIKEGLAKKIRDNFFGEVQTLYNHPKLETADHPIQAWPYSVVIAEPILQAHEKNKEIPAVDMKELLAKIVFHDSYRRRYEYDDTELMLNTARDIAKINNLESFVEELINVRQPVVKDARVLNRLNFRMDNLQSKKNKSDTHNVYDMSVYVKKEGDYRPNDIVYNPLDTVSNRSNNVRSDIIMNMMSKAPIKNIKDNAIYKEQNFFIKYKWFTKNQKIPNDGHFILKYDWNYTSLPSDWINKINSSVDEIWVSNNFVLNNYIDSGLDNDKIRVIHPIIDTDFYKKNLNKSVFKSNKTLKLLFIGEFNNNSGIKTLLRSYCEEFCSDDDISLIIKDNWKGILEDQKEVKDFISSLQANQNNPEIILIDNLKVDDIINLYSSCQCFVYPYSQDSTAIQILEAMSCELPILTINNGAAIDYCNSENSYFVDAELEETDIEEIDNLSLVSNANIFKINESSLKNKLRYIFENSSELGNKGKKSREIILNKFNADKIFSLIDQSILSMTKTPIIRHNINQIKSNWLNKAFSAFKEKKYLIAEGLFTKLCNYENNSDYFYNLGLTEFRLGKYDEAAYYFSLSLEMGICTYELCNYLAISLDKTGEKESADIFHKKALELKK